jgi:hypothetical protein
MQQTHTERLDSWRLQCINSRKRYQTCSARNKKIRWRLILNRIQLNCCSLSFLGWILVIFPPEKPDYIAHTRVSFLSLWIAQHLKISFTSQTWRCLKENSSTITGSLFLFWIGHFSFKFQSALYIIYYIIVELFCFFFAWIKGF